MTILKFVLSGHHPVHVHKRRVLVLIGCPLDMLKDQVYV